MTEKADAKTIGSALQKAAEAGEWTGGAAGILAALGYKSERTPLPAASPEAFFAAAGETTKARGKLLQRANSLDIVFQFTGEEVAAAEQGRLNIAAKSFEEGRAESFIFAAADIKPEGCNRGDYAEMTREINKRFAAAPTVAAFRNGERLTLAFTERRPNKRDDGRDVLGRVTMIKDIRMQKPHRAHLDILSELSLPSCAKWIKENGKPQNFDGLLKAWLAKLDIEELNRKFYRELFNWFERAAQEAKFPPASPKGEQVIRLITRLLFVWFIKEKELVAEEWFNPAALRDILKNFNNGGGDYYRAVLQNLFFATLNAKIGNRGFSPQKREGHRVASLYRYRSLIADEKRFLSLMRQTPFVNGGLFDCLDDDERGGTRIDMFSDPDPAGFASARKKAWENLRVPDELFFGKGGLIPILQHYKFTVEENTPVEQDVALDPELLGRVFENLLAANVDETRESARKQTGSYYTPRPVVDYMVEESLVAALAEKCEPANGGGDSWRGRLRSLLDYSFPTEKAGELFGKNDEKKIVRAVAGLKVLDPAVGSGAFPMGVLHKLTLALRRLDPENKLWQELQKERAMSRVDEALDKAGKEARQKALDEINEVFERYRDSDYGRKLYLIQNGVFGVDIQPVACQIAKLRFFISLAIEQKTSGDPGENYGVKPLPNLETRFVAANSLVKIARRGIASQKAQQLERELRANRERHFHATARRDKLACRERDRKLRGALAAELKRAGFDADSAEKIAQWDPYDQNSRSGWFDPKYMFGAEDGFDIVIGNPPYVRADAGAAHLAMRREIEKSGEYETLFQKWDLFIPFMEAGFKLLDEGGFTSFIVPDAFCHAKYAERSREWFLKNSRVARLDFYGKIKIFEAGVHNISYLAQRASGVDNAPLRRLHTDNFGNVTVLSGGIQSEVDERDIFFLGESPVAVSDNCVLLKEIFYISYGLRANNAPDFAENFVTSDLMSDKADKLHPVPFVRGKDVGRFCVLRVHYLEWGTHRSPQGLYTPTFPEFQNAPEKIIVQKNTGDNEVKLVYDDGQIHFDASTTGFVPWRALSGVVNKSIIKSARYRFQRLREGEAPREELEEISRRFSLHYVCGVMSSKYARKMLDANRRNNISIYPNDWKNLPIPDAPDSEQEAVADLVRKIIAAKAGDAGADTSEWEGEIDRLVYNLYGLTEKEIALVEGRHS